ncbi:MAG: hypothetical protein HQK77_15255 [Desulfobacterales bacterium]|nr:hypothetical protein [Desulfobacterales bacterium]
MKTQWLCKYFLVTVMFSCLLISNSYASINGLWQDAEGDFWLFVQENGGNNFAMGAEVKADLSTVQFLFGNVAGSSLSVSSLNGQSALSAVFEANSFLGTMTTNEVTDTIQGSLLLTYQGGPYDGIWQTNLNNYLVYASVSDGTTSMTITVDVTLNADNTIDYDIFIGTALDTTFVGTSIISKKRLKLMFTDAQNAQGTYSTNTMPPQTTSFTAVQLIGIGSKDIPVDHPDNSEVTTFSITIGEKDGRTIKPLNGLNAGPLATGDATNVDLVEEYKALGIHHVRTHDYYGPFDMAEMYPDRTKNPEDSSSFNLTESDRHFEGIAAAGCELYFRIGDSYNNSTPPASSELNNWISAAINVISHYSEGKWDGYSSNIEYIEIWNEPDNSQFWPGKTLLDFFVLFDKTAKAVKAKFPNAKIGGPGFTQQVNLDDSKKEKLKNFLDYIKKNNTPLDFISVHQYTNDPSQITTALNSLYSILEEKGFNSIDVHLTEWNTDTEGDQTPEEAVELRINSRGAAVNTAIWMEMQNNGIDMAFFFRGNDTSMDLSTFYGIYMADGTPKKTAFAFSFFNDLSNYPERLTVSASDTSLYIIAGQNSAGKKAMIVSNISDKNYNYTTNLDSHISKILEISDNYSVIQQINAKEGVINMPAYGIHYIEFE